MKFAHFFTSSPSFLGCAHYILNILGLQYFFLIFLKSALYFSEVLIYIIFEVVCTAKNIKALREREGLLQSDFAAQFGVKANTYSNYELGITEPRISFWKAVAERYHVTLDFLLDFTDDPHGSKYGDDFILSLSEKNLVEAWRRADEKERRIIAAALEEHGFSFQEKDTVSEGAS